MNDFATFDMLPYIPLHFLCTHFWQLVHCNELLPTPLLQTPTWQIIWPQNCPLHPKRYGDYLSLCFVFSHCTAWDKYSFQTPLHVSLRKLKVCCCILPFNYHLPAHFSDHYTISMPWLLFSRFCVDFQTLLNTLTASQFIMQVPAAGLKLFMYWQDSIYILTKIVYSHSPGGSNVC